MTAVTAVGGRSIPARAVALDVLQGVVRRHRPLDEVLDDEPGLSSLEPRDRAFVHALVAGTLRRLGRIDPLITQCLDRPMTARMADIRDILRLGACQLLFLGTPPHAAVDTAVALAAERHGGAYKGLVNAVLRRMSREGPGMAAAQDAVKLNTPEWMWRSWSRAYGNAACRRIAEASMAEAPLDLTARADPAGWAAALEADLLPTGTLRRPQGGPVADLPGYGEGAWWVQDAAAALPARLLGDVSGLTVADLCAAPGGKTVQLAAAGARVIAVDRSERRLVRLAANLERLRLPAETVAADAATWSPAEPVDAVLVDAPCTSTGTLRRHPDVARLKSPGDVAKLRPIQDALLASAAAMLRPGGLLVYCVCSLQPEEGPQRVAAALSAGLPLRRVPITPDEIGGLAECLTADGDLRTLPFHLADRGGMDAFYASRLQRI